MVLPPSVGVRTAEALLDGLDGLLLTGGTDLEPGYYGEGPIPELGATIPERDALEMVLLSSVIARYRKYRSPTDHVGICGLQHVS